MRNPRGTSAYLSVLIILVLSILTLPLLGGGTAAVAANSDWTETGISGISILDMEAVDANTAWAVGYSLTQGFILKTTDGGANWVKQKSVSGIWPAQPFSSISVVDASTAWASGDRNVYKTTDGGTNWNAVYTSEALIEGIPDIGAVDEYNAWAITTDALLNSNIMRTTDGGGTWAVLYTQTVLQGVLSRVSAVDNFNAWVAGGALTNGTVSVSGTVLKTNSMGLLWENVTPSGAPLLMNVQALDASDVWVSGSGVIMHSTDGGATWTTPYTSSGTDFWGLSATGDGIVWASGKTPVLPTGAKIVKTTNNGSTWTSVYSNTLLRHLFCVASVDASKAWAGGGNSTSTGADILRTVKGGDSLPDIAAITPPYALVGDTVTISGSDFGATRGTSKVLFSGAEAASYTSWSSNAITVTVPSDSGWRQGGHGGHFGGDLQSRGLPGGPSRHGDIRHPQFEHAAHFIRRAPHHRKRLPARRDSEHGERHRRDRGIQCHHHIPERTDVFRRPLRR